MTRLELFKCARDRMYRIQSEPAAQSICKQLDYLIELEEGRRSDYSRLHDIIIGVLTVREIETVDDACAELLYRVTEEVEAMKNSFPTA
jgi:hypothetical protein